jgi:hypothetical protein
MNLNNLPFKVFGIKRMPENPLWNKYISFMNHIFDMHFEGSENSYYGIDEDLKYDLWSSKISFENNIITLEEFFKLIKKDSFDNPDLYH